MQNLRDKLLKAGKVNQKQARQAAHEERQERQKSHAEAQEAQARREQLYQAQLEEQRERNRVIVEQERAQREARERGLRVQYLADHWAVRVRRGQQRWYFAARNGKILHFVVDERVASGLEHGQYGIVERPRAQHEDEGHQIVERQAAELIWEIEAAHVRFFNRNYTARPPRAWECVD
jgi:uncharacterized protein YaiL (DUF2058 family)